MSDQGEWDPRVRSVSGPLPEDVGFQERKGGRSGSRAVAGWRVCAGGGEKPGNRLQGEEGNRRPEGS